MSKPSVRACGSRSSTLAPKTSGGRLIRTCLASVCFRPSDRRRHEPPRGDDYAGDGCAPIHHSRRGPAQTGAWGRVLCLSAPPHVREADRLSQRGSGTRRVHRRRHGIRSEHIQRYDYREVRAGTFIYPAQGHFEPPHSSGTTGRRVRAPALSMPIEVRISPERSPSTVRGVGSG